MHTPSVGGSFCSITFTPQLHCAQTALLAQGRRFTMTPCRGAPHASALR